MATNEEIIWQYLKSQGLTDAGAAGLMGNLYAESGLNPQNLQNTYEKKLGYTDATYTQAVDNGKYRNFIKDGAGYGIAQWTYWSRKQGLYNYAKDNNTSIGDLNTQLGFLFSELSTGYKSLLKTLKTTTSIKEASNGVLLQFEKPANQGQTVQNTRINYSQIYYDKYKSEGGSSVSNSSLATYTRITNNKTTLSSKTLNRITIHCFVGQVTAKQGVDYFATTSNQCSANYVVGYDGSIGCSVDEKDRSWCSSSSANDKQAITIEVASEKTTPYKVTDEAYAALLNLIEDICRRNGKTKVIWNSNKTTALNYSPADNEVILTVHRWFANKACVPLNSEVLTKEGWKTLSELKLNEEIATVMLNEDLSIYFDRVLDKVEPYKAKTITCQNFTGTEDHRMLYWSKTSPQNLKFKSYKELLNSGSHINRLSFAGHLIESEGKGLDLSDDLLKFLVAVQADGHYMLEYRAENSYPYGVEFYMKKERKINRIINLIESLGYPYRINEKTDGSKSIKIYNDKDNFNIIDICEKWLTNKCFNWNWLNMSQAQFEIFFTELFEWDGNKDAKIYTSTKQINLDIISALAALHGKAGHVYNNNYSYREDSSFSLDKWKDRVENPEELVSCVTVKTGAFLCRQNGYTFLIGNCPGDYLYNKHSEIASTITSRLNPSATISKEEEEEEEVTQEQFNTMMNNWISEQAKKDPGTYSADARTWAEKNGLINGDTSGNKMYKKFITREEFVVVLNRLMENIKKGIG